MVKRPWLSTIRPLSQEIDRALEQVEDSLEVVSGLESALESATSVSPDDRELRPDPFNERRSLLYNLNRALPAARASMVRAAPVVNSTVVTLTGDAGIGKKHLLCDLARERVDSGMPTVLLTGRRFQGNAIHWVQALQHLDVTDVNAERFLGGLEAAAQAANARALLIIDAVNEGEGAKLWHLNIASFLETVNRHQWNACVLLIRSIYEEAIIPDHVRDAAVNITHHGFADRSYCAAKAYLQHYRLALPSTPLLQPEVENPLFLDLFCRGLQGKGVEY